MNVVPISSPPDIRVFVNEQGVTIPRESTALDAVRAYSAERATDIADGRSRITDSRGLPLEPNTAISGGAIMRVVPVREATANSGSAS
jgi:hypothetical protein